MIKVSRKMTHNLAVIYAVGVVGFSISFTRYIFIRFTPLLLLFSIALLLWYDGGIRKEKQLKRIGYYSFVFIVGFLVEVWGVNSGLLFGNYIYGNGLGPKILGTPPIIGLNWVLMIYLTSAIFTTMKRNILNGILWPSLLMVGYDFIMEHVAPIMDMWSWKNDLIPLKNYIMWGVLALIFHSIRYVMNVRDHNHLALTLFIVQIIFFLLILFISSIF